MVVSMLLLLNYFLCLPFSLLLKVSGENGKMAFGTREKLKKFVEQVNADKGFLAGYRI